MAIYSEQAKIPQVAERSGPRRIVKCPACGKMTIAIGVWPGWCICGWNVDAARRVLAQQRSLPVFFVLFFEISVVSFVVFRGISRISASGLSMPDWKLLAFMVGAIAAAAWYGYHRTRWYAEALECVQEALFDDDIAWSGASPDWKPEAELLQPVPRSVRGADLKNLKSIVVIFGFISAGIVVEGYLHAGPQALGGQLYPSKAWAIASGIMLLMTTIYFLVSKIYRREADLLRRGHVVPALVTKVKEHIETDG